MDRISNVTDKLWQVKGMLDEIREGVQPILDDYRNIRSSDDQYECMDFGWASFSSSKALEVIEHINDMIEDLEQY